jgi:hypothetical protein
MLFFTSRRVSAPPVSAATGTLLIVGGDSNNRSAVPTSTIGDPEPMSLNSSPQDLSCFCDCDRKAQTFRPPTVKIFK